MKTLKLKKVTSKNTKKTDAKNVSNVKRAITAIKDLMYIYPKDCTTLPERKKFRTDARRHRDAFIRDIKKAAPGSEREAIRSEAIAFGKKTFAESIKF